MATQTSPLASTNPDWLAYMQAQQNPLAMSQGNYTPQAQALMAQGDPNATLSGAAPQAQTAQQQVQAPGQPQALPQLPTTPSANSGTPIGLSGVGNPVTGTPSAADTFSQAGQGNAGTDQNDILEQAYRNQNFINQGGQLLTQQGENEANYFGNQQSTYDQAQAQALNALAATPGYTSAQAATIGQDFSKYNTSAANLNAEYLTPEQQSAALGNTAQPVQTAYQGTANEGAQLNAYDANLGGQVNAYGSDLSGQLGNNSNFVGGATQALGANTGAAVGTLSSDLQNSQAGFSQLNSVVDNPALQFDPNSTEQQITPAQMQQMETAAGTTIGNQFGTAEDTLRRNAAAAGNTSPLALAAANDRLQTSEASQAGQASTNAIIAANNAQYSRAAAIEAQREGAVQAQTGLQAGAATTEQSQAQSAAALAGTQGIGAAENVGQAGIGAAENVGSADIAGANAYANQAIGAANSYGTAALNEQNTMTGQQYAAQNTAEQENAARALALAQNQQTTTTGINQTQYAQGTGSAGLTSQGAQTVGNATIAGQNQYRSGVQAQQNEAQSGVQNATATQQNAYGTETSGLNASTATAANMKTNQPSVLGDLTSVAKALSGPATAAAGAATGAVITKPEVRLIAEKGPELVTSLKPRYRQPQRMAA